MLDCEVEIPAYDILRRDRNKNEGRIAMYIWKNIPYSNRKDLAVGNIEVICFEVKKPKSKPLLIATWYRPPSPSIELFSDFEKFLQLVDDKIKEIIITGDLNCNLLEQARSQVTSRLLDVMDNFQLQQHIQTPTRITPTTSSLIDVIITQIGDSKTLETGVIQLGISDHSLLYLCRKISIPKEPSRIIFTRQFKNYPASLFKQELSYYLSSYVTSDDPTYYGTILRPTSWQLLRSMHLSGNAE